MLLGFRVVDGKTEVGRFTNSDKITSQHYLRKGRYH